MRPLVPPGCRLMLTSPNPSHVCSWAGSIPRRLLCYDALTVGYPSRKGLARKASELGEEVEH